MVACFLSVWVVRRVGGGTARTRSRLLGGGRRRNGGALRVEVRDVTALRAVAGVEHAVDERGASGGERLGERGGQLLRSRDVVSRAPEGLDEPLVVRRGVQHRRCRVGGDGVGAVAAV